MKVMLCCNDTCDHARAPAKPVPVDEPYRIGDSCIAPGVIMRAPTIDGVRDDRPFDLLGPPMDVRVWVIGPDGVRP